MEELLALILQGLIILNGPLNPLVVLDVEVIQEDTCD
jgi:hypothetical protein